MGLEAATYIHQLDSNNPVGASDPKAQGDDHLRMMKAALQNTFPNIEGEVLATHTELNLLTGTTGVTGTASLVRSADSQLTGATSAATLNASEDLQVNSKSVVQLPATSKSASYALVATDKAQLITQTTSGTTMSLGDLPEGFVAMIANESSGNITISATDGTLRLLDGKGSPLPTGNRTLARAGVCTVTRIAEDEWRIFGTGLS